MVLSFSCHLFLNLNNMKYFKSSLALAMLFLAELAWSSDDPNLPRLHVEGRHLKDPHGNTVILHGYAQTFSPWFNERGTKWNNYDVNGCLNYNKGIIDRVLDAGWEMNFVRMHMDPYWSSTPGCEGRYEGEECFNETRFRTYLDKVFIPMAEYAVSKGLYVVLRPPGVAPDEIEVGGVYHDYLLNVWDIVASHPKLKNHPNIMFELANEPIQILGTDGTYGSTSQAHFDNLKIYFQEIVDLIREKADNILWIPGLGWQSQYQGFAVNPIEGKNIGYAVHVYPGWFNSGQGYAAFQNGWNNQVQPVADFAPVIITEMDWAPEKYESSWGKGITGLAGGDGFGANFKKITDDAGNVSWLLFTEPHLLANFTGTPPAQGQDYTFLNDPEACPWPIFNWYQEYAEVNYPRPDYVNKSHSDNGDGTYTNPVVFGDFPDPDVILVGDTYYMVSTTMHIFPGATILKSHDLVNWEYCNNPLEKIDNADCYNLNGCDRYSHGQWASSLKFNNGTFYLLFNTLDEGSFLLTTTDPEGSWEMKQLSDSFYDPGLFFDDDEKIYVVFGINELRICELDENFNKIDGTEQLVFTATFRDGLEGSHLYKIGDYYYIYATYGGFPAFQVALRSSDIYGPYEEKKLLEDDNIHQGALIETQTGEWWTMLFYDKGAYGRLPNLQPVTWVNDWPEIGVGGKGVTTYQKPDVGREYPITALPTNDSFRAYKLGLQWGWNHNPDNSKWSLIERPDYLRLTTANVTSDLRSARNTLTQRILGYRDDPDHSYGTIKMEIDHMTNGDVAGLALFQDPYGYVGVKMENGEKKLVAINDGMEVEGPVVTASVIFLRAVANYNTSKASFYYSLDNEAYTKLGMDLSMSFDPSVFTGNKFCLFNYATEQTGGFVDIDWFSTEENFSEDKFYDDSFVGYSEEALTLVDIEIDNQELYVLTGSHTSINVTAVYQDGRREDISIGATYNNPNPEIIRIFNGQITASKDGAVDINVSFEGPLGHKIDKNVHVVASTFPLIDGLFDPTIWENGTFDESTNTVQTGQWGFAGWEYDGIDLSDYNYVIAKLASGNNADVQFRLFDESSYWSSPVSYPFQTGEVIVPLHSAAKEDNSSFDPSHVYIVGFWSNGSNPFVIDTVYLASYLDSDPPTLLVKDENGGTVNELSGFNYIKDQGPSDSQSFKIYGYRLADQVEVTAPDDFEISLNQSSGYGTSLSLNTTDGELDETTIYVRMKAGLNEHLIAGSIVLTSTGLASKSIQLSGTISGTVLGSDGLPEANSRIVFTQCYSLSGKRIPNVDRAKGILIIREFYEDGTITVRKIFKP